MLLSFICWVLYQEEGISFFAPVSVGAFAVAAIHYHVLSCRSTFLFHDHTLSYDRLLRARTCFLLDPYIYM